MISGHGGQTNLNEARIPLPHAKPPAQRARRPTSLASDQPPNHRRWQTLTRRDRRIASRRASRPTRFHRRVVGVGLVENPVPRVNEGLLRRNSDHFHDHPDGQGLLSAPTTGALKGPVGHGVRVGIEDVNRDTIESHDLRPPLVAAERPR